MLLSDMTPSLLLNAHSMLVKKLMTLPEPPFWPPPNRSIHPAVYGLCRWIRVFYAEILSRQLIPYTRLLESARGNYPDWLAEPAFIADYAEILPPHKISDEVLLQLHLDAAQSLQDSFDLLLDSARGWMAPGEDTMAAESLDRALQETAESDIVAASALGILTGEINRRGLDPIPVKKPLPIPKVESVSYPDDGGAIYRLEKRSTTNE